MKRLSKLIICLFLGSTVSLAASDQEADSIQRSLQELLKKASAAYELDTTLFMNIHEVLKTVKKVENASRENSRIAVEVLAKTEAVCSDAEIVKAKQEALESSVRELQATSRDIVDLLEGLRASVAQLRAETAGQRENSLPTKCEGLTSQVSRLSDVFTLSTKTSEKQLKKIEDAVVRDLPKTIADFKKDASEKLDKVQVKLESMPDLIHNRNWTETLQQAVTKFHAQRASWNVENVRETIVNSKDPAVWLSSRNFSLAGYKVQLLVSAEHIDGDRWFGLFFALCPSADDSLLQWPFRTPATLTLHHPKDPAKDVFGHVTTADIVNVTWNSFTRPCGKCNLPYGNHQLRSWEYVQREGFVLDDALSVSVTLFPEF